MKLCYAVTILVTTVIAYYIYTPVPNSIPEQWKVMLVYGGIRAVMDLGVLFEHLGLCHYIQVTNFFVDKLEIETAHSSEGVRVNDTTFAGIQVRVFESTRGQEGALRRGVVYFHGGGWAAGSARMRSYDFLCRTLAERLNAVVVSVDYRLAPDVVFPGQYYDALKVSRYFLQPKVLAQYSVDPTRVGVSGDSAGGNLAAALAQELVLDTNMAVKFQVQALIYPALQALDFNTASYQQNQGVLISQRPVVARFWLDYLGGDRRLLQSLLANNQSALDLHEVVPHQAKFNWTKLLPPEFRKHYKPVLPLYGSTWLLKELPGLLDPRAAPLLAEPEVLAQVPPTYILTCEHDVLRDDGLMYGQRLEELGVAVTNDHFEDSFHGCMSFAFWPTYSEVGIRCVDSYIRWMDKNL